MLRYSVREDSEAIVRLKRGDIGGLEPLVRKYQLRATRAAYLVTRDLPLSEDIVQAAFLRTYDRIDQFDLDRPFAPWFLRIIVNDAVKAVAKRDRQVSLDRELSEEESSLIDLLPDPNPGPEELAEQSEARRIIWGALGQLPLPQQAAIILHYYAGLKEAEVAKYVDAPAGTVKWRLSVARDRLRLLLSSLLPGR